LHRVLPALSSLHRPSAPVSQHLTNDHDRAKHNPLPWFNLHSAEHQPYDVLFLHSAYLFEERQGSTEVHGVQDDRSEFFLADSHKNTSGLWQHNHAFKDLRIPSASSRNPE
jgi:hypothetical protein